MTRSALLATAAVAAVLALAAVPTLAAGGAVPPPLGLSTPALLASAQGPAPAALTKTVPVSLNRAVSVIADVVRLGDLFTGQGMEGADRAVARAPAPGEHLTLDAAWLADTAARHGLAWRPLDAGDHAVVSRQANHLSPDYILNLVAEALAAAGMPVGADIELASALPPVAVAAGAAVHPRVIAATWDGRQNRFSASVEVPADAGPPRLIDLHGRAWPTVEIPVLIQAVARGQVIGPADVDWQRIRVAGLNNGMLTDPAQVVGMAARRTLRPGEPVRARDVERPEAVGKNDLVAMVVETPLMTLTAQGKALEGGAVGDSVRVQNVRSGKTLIGIITAPRTVTIQSGQTAGLR